VCIRARNLCGQLETYDVKFYEDMLLQQISQSQQQGFKLIKKTKVEPIDGQETMDIEYKYDLFVNGNALGRHGYAKVVKVGNSVVALGAQTTDGRWKKNKEDLAKATGSFRAHIVKAEFESKKSGVSINTDIKNDAGGL